MWRGWRLLVVLVRGLDVGSPVCRIKVVRGLLRASMIAEVKFLEAMDRCHGFVGASRA